MMKLAIAALGPGLADRVCDQFGRAPYLILVDPRTSECEPIDNRANEFGPERSGLAAARMVSDHGAEAVLTGRMGPKAFAALEEASIGSYVATGMTVAEAIAAFRGGRLKRFSGDMLLAPPLPPWCAPPSSSKQRGETSDASLDSDSSPLRKRS